MSAHFNRAIKQPPFGLQLGGDQVNVLRVNPGVDASVRRYAKKKGYQFVTSVTDGVTRYQIFIK